MKTYFTSTFLPELNNVKSLGAIRSIMSNAKLKNINNPKKEDKNDKSWDDPKANPLAKDPDTTKVDGPKKGKDIPDGEIATKDGQKLITKSKKTAVDLAPKTNSTQNEGKTYKDSEFTDKVKYSDRKSAQDKKKKSKEVAEGKTYKDSEYTDRVKFSDRKKASDKKAKSKEVAEDFVDEGKTFKDSDDNKKAKFTNRDSARSEKNKSKWAKWKDQGVKESTVEKTLEQIKEDVEFSDAELEKLNAISDSISVDEAGNPLKKKVIFKKLNPGHSVKEEVLDERRGRPSADGDSDDATEANQHPIMQHRKNVNLKGAHPIKFSNGESKAVPHHLSKAVIDHHDSLGKPHEKEKFSASIHKSRADLGRTLHGLGHAST